MLMLLRVTFFFADALPLPMQDLLCMNNDFPPRAHCLVRWYVYCLSSLIQRNSSRLFLGLITVLTNFSKKLRTGTPGNPHMTSAVFEHC